MTTTINASTSTGLVQTADTSGIIKLQSNGVTTNALAWINFNANAQSVRASYNVTSITYNGTGSYTLNLTNNLSDTNACVLVSAGGMDTGTYVSFPTLGSYNGSTNFILATNQVRLYQSSPGAPNQTNPYFYCCAIFGN